MRYVTTKREEEKLQNGNLIIRQYREKKFELLDILAIAGALLITFAIIFSMGILVGAYTSTYEITEAEIKTETVTETVTEEVMTDFYNPAVPLTYDEQNDLYNASEEFGVDYCTMLGLIEKETNFRNVYGDVGKAYGYCQVWNKWWSGLMNEIGASDLNVPKDNFRTACAIVSRLTEKYGSIEGALTAYNKGSYNGVASGYAKAVIKNADKWRGV